VGCYAAQIGVYLPTFRGDLSVQSSSVQQFLKMGPILIVPKRRLITTILRRVKCQKSEDLILTAAEA
jgi:hypothetical protein